MSRSIPTPDRRFEFIAGSSSKFWQICVVGKEVIVCFGRIGSNGQRQTKSFPDPAAAQKHAATLIQQKLARGYCEVDSPRAA